MRRWPWLMLPILALGLSLAPDTRAEVDEATRAAARAVAEDALGRFDRGDYAGALELFNRADALVHAPTLGLMAARCLQKLGRVVEASERYLAVTRVQLGPSAHESQAKAQVTAAAEREALLPQIPSVVISVEGAAPAEVRVTIDGQPVPAELLGLKRPTDPGAHRIEATRGSDVASREVVLKPGDLETITLRLPPARPVPERHPDHVESAEGKDTSRASGLGPAGWAGVGLASLGGAGLVAGAITGGLALSAKSNLDAAGCVGGRCPPSQSGAVNRYDTLRIVSGASLVAGGIGAAAGVTLAIVGARRSPRPATARLAPWIGLGTVGVAGTY